MNDQERMNLLQAAREMRAGVKKELQHAQETSMRLERLLIGSNFLAYVLDNPSAVYVINRTDVNNAPSCQISFESVVAALQARLAKDGVEVP